MPASHGGPSLPNELLKQLGIGPSEPGKAGKKNFHTRAQGRKERRKQERQDKKSHNGGTRSHTNPQSRPQVGSKGNRAAQGSNTAKKIKAVNGDQRKTVVKNAGRTAQLQLEEEDEEQETFHGFESDDDVDEEDFDDMLDESDEDSDSGEEAPAPRLSKADQDKMARDDAEIARLEKKLGMKGKKALPKSFQEDGLGDLLGELDGDSASETEPRKRKRSAVDDEWLAEKRMKLEELAANVKRREQSENHDVAPLSGQDSDLDSIDPNGILDKLLDPENWYSDESDEDLDDVDGVDTQDGDEEEPPEMPRQRENPYVAPVTASTAKWVPPSRQKTADADSEASKLTQRKANRLMNKMTEANFITTMKDIEKLYQESPRQDATEAIVNSLIALLRDRLILSDTTIMDYAGYATAIYKVIGSTFGAYLIQRVVDEFKTHYDQVKAEPAGHKAIAKEPWNLIVFITQLYMFRMIGSKLIIGYIRMLLTDLSELNAELLLRILRTSGQRLRTEDPVALKDILGLIRPAVDRAGGQNNLSVRAQFMIETLYDLKNNKMKNKEDSSQTSNLDRAARLTKALGSLNTRRLKANEPLQLSLEDLERAGKQGKWWLVGASWAGADAANAGGVASVQPDEAEAASDPDVDADYFPDLPDLQKLNELAKAEGMNTDARYSIFRSLLVSTDSHEAYLRLQRLRLNKTERREIPSVIIRCSGSEVKYNPFYTEVAQRVCSDHKAQWGFQDALWKLFKRVGETLFDEDDGEDDAGDDEELDVERLTNVGTMYGELIAHGALGIKVLKCLNFAMLRPKTQAAVLAIIISLLRTKMKLGKGKKDGREAAIKEPFLAVDSAEFARGLKYFLKKVVRKAKDVKKDKGGLLQAVALAEEALVEVETRESE